MPLLGTRGGASARGFGLFGGFATIPPRAILVYGNSGIYVYNGTTLANVTSTFVSNPTLVASAGGTERVNVTSNNRYLGFGSWARAPALKGAVADTNTTPWTFYSNFTGLAIPGTGNDIVERLAPSTNGSFVIGESGNGTDKGVFSFTAPSTEFTGQPTQFTSIPFSADTMPITIGNTAWIIAGANWHKFTFTSSTLAFVSTTNVSPASSGNGYISFDSTNTVALINLSNTLYKVDISSGTPVYVAAYSPSVSPNTVRSTVLSPDGTKAILVCNNAKVYVYTFATNSTVAMSTPSGFTGNWDSVDFFADGNNYVVVGAGSDGYSHLGRISSGGYVSLLGGTNYGGYNVRCLRPIV
jgi:hypothetical protein